MTRRAVLFRRQPHDFDGPREVSRALAHRLLDNAMARNSDVGEREITAALWATGDLVPIPRAIGQGSEPMT